MTDKEINKEIENMITQWIVDLRSWLSERYEADDEQFELFLTAFEILLRDNVKHLDPQE
jgi:hypothetical protein